MRLDELEQVPHLLLDVEVSVLAIVAHGLLLLRDFSCIQLFRVLLLRLNHLYRIYLQRNEGQRDLSHPEQYEIPLNLLQSLVVTACIAVDKVVTIVEELFNHTSF